MANTHEITLTVNGQSVTRAVEPRLLLVYFLRDALGLTGTHVGCDTTQCGACTVMLGGKAVKSCTILAVQADGQECGYCTPGMIMSARALLNENPHPSEAEIRRAIDGNLCRCTGYEGIVRSIEWAADNPAPAGA